MSTFGGYVDDKKILTLENKSNFGGAYDVKNI